MFDTSALNVITKERSRRYCVIVGDPTTTKCGLDGPKENAELLSAVNLFGDDGDKKMAEFLGIDVEKKTKAGGTTKGGSRSKKGTAAGGPLPDELLAAMSGASVSKKKKK